MAESPRNDDFKKVSYPAIRKVYSMKTVVPSEETFETDDASEVRLIAFKTDIDPRKMLMFQGSNGI